jgi:AraC-like DNA-binding protein/quercetin dioxygenase-like cupin family protein
MVIGLRTEHFLTLWLSAQAFLFYHPRMSRRPIREQVPQHEYASFDCEVIQGQDYGSRWHFHPEVQITLALKSAGYRIVGDNISPLHDGDCVLVGADVPHVWHQDHPSSREGVHAIVVRFREDQPWLSQPEMNEVRRLLQRARRGLVVGGKTRKEAQARLQKLSQETGLGRLIELLRVLHLLSESNEVKPLASASFRPALDATDQERMGRILRFIQERLVEDIARDELARVAALSPGAFSRYFKSRTGKTLPEYVNELRIGRACRMLAETDAAVTDVAFDCGFRNLANFNRWFLKLTHLVPRAYRQKMLQAGH